jgi:hypothetical protein
MTPENLLKLCEAATPGKWNSAITAQRTENLLEIGETRHGRPHRSVQLCKNDADFIAAANPQTVSELCRRVIAAEKALADIRDGADYEAQIAAECYFRNQVKK